MVVIEIGIEKDCPEVLALLQEAFAPYKSWLVPQSGVFRESIETLKRKLQSDHTLLKATIKGKIVGALFYTPQGKALYFGRLAVLAAYQKQGIARQLIEHVERAAKAEGFERVTLEVRIVLRDNIECFRTLGYTVVGMGAHEGFNEPTYYKMAKEINQ